jgi:type 1 fimbria pilin
MQLLSQADNQPLGPNDRYVYTFDDSAGSHTFNMIARIIGDIKGRGKSHNASTNFSVGWIHSGDHVKCMRAHASIYKNYQTGSDGASGVGMQLLSQADNQPLGQLLNSSLTGVLSPLEPALPVSVWYDTVPRSMVVLQFIKTIKPVVMGPAVSECNCLARRITSH